jgi:hypothetical protein
MICFGNVTLDADADADADAKFCDEQDITVPTRTVKVNAVLL